MASYKLRIIVTIKSAPAMIEREKNAVNSWQREQDGRKKAGFCDDWMMIP